ncbi:MAG: lycopene cyclase family protein, partial [Bacteroidota bacterium]
DFRVEQVDGYPCFVYVLPTDAHHALVEYTVFSPDAWTNAAYDVPLHRYMEENLGLWGNFQVLHTEYGQIPMTDYDFEGVWRRRYPDLPGMVPIGTMGGLGRPSTGYTFTNIQRHCEVILQELTKTRKADFGARMPSRFKHYDRSLLRVLVERKYPGHALFERLFDQNPTALLLAFLDGQSRFGQEITIMNRSPRPVMMSAMIRNMLGNASVTKG